MGRRISIGGLVGIIIGMALNVVVVILASTIGKACIAGACTSAFVSKNLIPLFYFLVSILIWPSTLTEEIVLKGIILGFYYFIVGAVIGLVYYLFSNGD